MTTWMETIHPDSLLPLEDFAQDYLQDKDHHSEIRTEDLAESFRAFCGLPPFPTLDDLVRACERLGIALDKLPAVTKLSGANTWSAGSGHSIFLRSDVNVAHAESTLSHEMREVIEQTFRRVKPRYVGLETHDNRSMNPRSDHFAGCLLMPRELTKARLRELGYDVVTFSYEVGRSLSSVIVRAQEIYAASQPTGIVGGLWLFQMPWTDSLPDVVPAAKMTLAYKAHLSGFSIQSTNRHCSEQRFRTKDPPLRTSM